MKAALRPIRETLLYADTRTLELFLALLSTVVGAAYLLDEGYRYGEHGLLPASGGTLFASGAVLIWGFSAQSCTVRRVGAGALAIAAIVNLTRGWMSGSVVLVSFFGLLAASALFLFARGQVASIQASALRSDASPDHLAV